MKQSPIHKKTLPTGQTGRAAADISRSPRDAFLTLAADVGFDSPLAHRRLEEVFDKWTCLHKGTVVGEALLVDALGDDRQAKVLRLLARVRQKGQVTRRDVVWHHITANSKQAHALLESMRDAGLLEYEEKTPRRGGRPSDVYRRAGK
jgi:hypothetical protein